MSIKHLNTQEITLLANGKLTGKPLVKALLHIEVCEICQAKMAAPDAGQILTAVFAEKRNANFNGNAAEAMEKQTARFWTPTLSGKRRNLSFGLATVCAAILAVFIGATRWFSAPSVNVTANREAIVVASPSANQNDQDETAKSLPAAENSLMKPPTIAQHRETVPGDKPPVGSPENQSRNASANEKPNDFAASAAKTNRQSNRSAAKTIQFLTSAERKELNQFLIKLPVVLASLRPPAINSRGSQNTDNQQNALPTHNFVLLAPQGETIRETQPEFKWQAAGTAESYKISVFNSDYQEVFSGTTKSNIYQGQNPLKRGETYFWQVTAPTPNGELASLPPSAPPPTALFRVASDKTIVRLQRLQIQKSSWKIITTLLREGMLSEAEIEINKILKGSPQNKLALNLLNRVQILRRHAATDKALSVSANSPK